MPFYTSSQISSESLKSYEAGKEELPPKSFKRMPDVTTEAIANVAPDQLSEEDKEKLTAALVPIHSFARKIFRCMTRYVHVGECTSDQGASFEIRLTKVDDTIEKLVISRKANEGGFQVRLCEARGEVYKPEEDVSTEAQVLRYLGQFEHEARCQLYNRMTMAPIKAHLANETAQQQKERNNRPRAGRKPFGSESDLAW